MKVLDRTASHALCLFACLILSSRTSKAEDGGSSHSGYDEDGNYYNQFSVCSDSVILVEEMSILCDSPGTYYYGSNKYRNSATCKAGDKAKVQILLLASEDMAANGIVPYVSLSAKGYGTVESVTLYEDMNLCELSGMQALDKQECGEAGYYQINEVFYWGEQDDNYEYVFSPKVTVGIKSSVDKNYYDLGGANTDLCAGNTFVNWTTGVTKSAANTLHTFFITFGILCGTILAVLGVAYFVMQKANSKPQEKLVDAEETSETDEEQEYHKIAMVGNNRDLVDF